MNKQEMVAEFQCPGCVCGSDTECGQYKPNEWGGCQGHVIGTLVMPGMIKFALGLPKGFNRPCLERDGEGWRASNAIEVRFWELGTKPDWDRLNVPVWAMVRDGMLFVRTVLPRVSRIITDVIDGGTLDMCPNAIDVGEFYDEID